MIYILTAGCQSNSETASKVAADASDTLENTADTPKIVWDRGELGEVPEGMMGEYITYGYKLITETQKYIGPNVADPSSNFLGII